jgi:hypothetical protein
MHFFLVPWILALIGLLYQPRMIEDDGRRAVGGMIRKGNRNTRKTPSPVVLSSPKIPRALSLSLSREAIV